MTSQVFPPERHPSGILWKELAEYLSGEGFEVTVATGFPNHPDGHLFHGFKRKLAVKEKLNGFTLIRSFHLASPSQKPVVRSLIMLSQAISFCISGLFAKTPQVILCGAPPLLGPLFSQVLARFFKAKIVYCVSDMYPDILIALGWLKNATSIYLAKLLERVAYKGADHIVVLSEGFRSTLINEKRVPADKISVIPLWLDKQDVVPGKRENAWRREIGISPEKFVVLYAGTLGWVSGAEVVIDTAIRLGDYADITFLLVGGGQVLDRMKLRARNEGLSNIRFAPFQARERLSEVQAAADVSLVTLAPGRGKTSLPSKVLGYMAAARPVVAAVDAECDIANIIRQAGCGLVVPPEDGKSLAQAILHYYHHPLQRESHGRKGREYFLQHFEKNAVITRYRDLLALLASS